MIAFWTLLGLALLATLGCVWTLYAVGCFDVAISRLQSRIASVYDAWVVPKPDRDFVKANARTGEEARERVAHRVGRYPFESYRGTVGVERSGEVVTITIFSSRHIGAQHVWITNPITFKKFLKCLCDRDCAFFSIFEVHSTRLTQMEQPIAQVKPERSRLDDFVLP